MRDVSEKSSGGASRPARRQIRPVLAAAALAALVASVAAGCGSGSSTTTPVTEGTGESTSSSDAGKHLNMAMFLVATANTYEQASVKGAEKAAEEDGNISLTFFNGNFSAATQSSQVEDAAAAGQYDALLVSAFDGQQIVPAITTALDEELTVVCGFEVCGPNGEEFAKQLPVAALIAASYVPQGEHAAEATVKGCEEKGYDPCNVVYFNGLSTQSAAILYHKGLTKVFEESPNINLIAEAEGQFLAGTSYKAMKPIIQAHPDINAVTAVGDQEISGVVKAIEESLLKSKEVVLVGNGASEIATKGVKSGVWYASTLLRPYNEGYLQVKYAAAAARGNPISPDVVNSTEKEGFPEGYIDAENVAQWKPEWAG